MSWFGSCFWKRGLRVHEVVIWGTVTLTGGSGALLLYVNQAGVMVAASCIGNAWWHLCL